MDITNQLILASRANSLCPILLHKIFFLKYSHLFSALYNNYKDYSPFIKLSMIYKLYLLLSYSKRFLLKLLLILFSKLTYSNYIS